MKSPDSTRNPGRPIGRRARQLRMVTSRAPAGRELMSRETWMTFTPGTVRRRSPKFCAGVVPDIGREHAHRCGTRSAGSHRERDDHGSLCWQHERYRRESRHRSDHDVAACLLGESLSARWLYKCPVEGCDAERPYRAAGRARSTRRRDHDVGPQSGAGLSTTIGMRPPRGLGQTRLPGPAHKTA